jgi:hypothetical protein
MRADGPQGERGVSDEALLRGEEASGHVRGVRWRGQEAVLYRAGGMEHQDGRPLD